MPRYVMAIDASKCLNCKACLIACQQRNAVPYGLKRGLQERGVHGVIGILGKEAQGSATAVFRLKLGKGTFFFHREFSK